VATYSPVGHRGKETHLFCPKASDIRREVHAEAPSLSFAFHLLGCEDCRNGYKIRRLAHRWNLETKSDDVLWAPLDPTAKMWMAYFGGSAVFEPSREQ